MSRPSYHVDRLKIQTLEQQLKEATTIISKRIDKIADLESRLEKQAEVIAVMREALGMIADDDGMSYMISGTHAYDIAKKALEKLK